MFEYKLIIGNKNTVETEVTKMLNDGWTPLDLTSTTIGSTVNFTQAMTREYDQQIKLDVKEDNTANQTNEKKLFSKVKSIFNNSFTADNNGTK